MMEVGETKSCPERAERFDTRPAETAEHELKCSEEESSQ